MTDETHRSESPERRPLTDDERRDAARRPVRVLRVMGQSGDEVFFGYASNVSAGGLFIQTVNPLALGTRYRIRFVAPAQEPIEVTCEAEVAWLRDVDPDSDLPPGMGLRFLEVDPALAERLAVFANEEEERDE